MSIVIKNIDKFLKNLFQNYRVKPSNGTWNKIAETLDNTNPKDALIPNVDKIGTLFKGYKVTPSEKVWHNISTILEKDKFIINKFSRRAASAIVAFFSNTTATVISSIVVLAGLSLILFNPFKDDPSKLAATANINQERVIDQKTNQTVINQQSSSPDKVTQADLFDKQQSTDNKNIPYTEPAKNIETTEANTQNNLVLNTSVESTTPVIQQKDISTGNVSQKAIITNNISESGNTKNNPIIPETKTKSEHNNDYLLKYSSNKIGIRQNNCSVEPATTIDADLQKNMDDLIDRFYRQWAKKFNRNRDVFYVEAFYMPVYGSTTFIANQENSDTLSRSYNEYLIANPGNCLGLNFGYNPNKIIIETGINYEDRHTQRNDDLTWISYNITQDSVGFIFNTIDSTYHTIYTIDTVKNKLLTQYRSRMSYHTIEVPLLFGYKLVDKKNSIIIRTGILTSFIINSAEETSNIDESARTYITYPERNKVDFSYVLNLSYDFNITNKLKISATPTFRYNITGMYKGYSINKGAATLGVGLGMKYIF